MKSMLTAKFGVFQLCVVFCALGMGFLIATHLKHSHRYIHVKHHHYGSKTPSEYTPNFNVSSPDITSQSLPETTDPEEPPMRLPLPDENEYVKYLAPSAKSWRCPQMKIELPTSSQVCKFNLTNDKEYLPDPQFLDDMGLEWWEEDKAKLLRNIQLLQHPKDCNDPYSEDDGRWHLVKPITSGIGFITYTFTTLVARHWESGIPVILNENLHWRFTDYACNKGFTCRLTPLSQCELTDIDPNNVRAIHHHGIPFPTLKNVCENGKWNPNTGMCDCKDGFVRAFGDNRTPSCLIPNDGDDHLANEEPIRKFLAAPGEMRVGASMCFFTFPARTNLRKKNGFFWWHAMNLEHMIINSPLYPKMQHWAQRRGLDHKNGKTCIAVHIRHGDSCFDPHKPHRICPPWEDYAAKIDLLESLYGHQKKIFVATDNSTIIHEIFRSKYGNRVEIQDISREKYESDLVVDDNPDLDDPQVTKEFFIDAVAMSMCGMFIGTFSSSMAWMTVELQAARLGHFAPFVSLDHPYAHEKLVGQFETWEEFSLTEATTKDMDYKLEYQSIGEREIKDDVDGDEDIPPTEGEHNRDNMKRKNRL